MKIIEYMMVQDEKYHPQLFEKNVYNWRGKDFNTYDKIVNMMNSCFHLKDLNEEHSYIVSFNNNLELVGVYELSHGTRKNCAFDLKALFSFLFLTGTDKYVFLHNHPCGALGISENDISFTKMINSYVFLFDIELMESIIVSKKGYTLIKDTVGKDVFHD